MNGYVQDILYPYHHTHPNKPQLSPQKHTDISYGSLVYYATEANSRSLLHSLGIKQFQGIVGALLFYARAVDNKLIVTLSTIGSQKVSTTELTLSSIAKLLVYMYTYSIKGITYCASTMVIVGNSDASFVNKIKTHSWSRSHIFLSEDFPIPSNKVPLLTLAQIIKLDNSSSSKSELASLFITTKKMPPFRQTLI